MQIIIPCNSFVEALESQHIKSYIASLDQDVAVLEKKDKRCNAKSSRC